MSVDIDLSWASSSIITLQQVFTEVGVKGVQNRKREYSIFFIETNIGSLLLGMATKKRCKIQYNEHYLYNNLTISICMDNI